MKVDAEEIDDKHQAETVNAANSEWEQRLLLWSVRHPVIGIIIACIGLMVVEIYNHLKGGER